MSHRAIILGSGRVGCYTGCCLLNAGWTVVFVGRESLLKEIEENDRQLSVSDLHGNNANFKWDDKKFKVTEELTSADQIEENDFILVCVKRAASEKVARDLKSLEIPRPYHLVSIQNGVDNTKVFRDILIDAQVSFISTIFGPNVVKMDNKKAHFRLATTNPILIEDNSEGSKTLAHGIEYGKRHGGPYIEVQLHPDMIGYSYGKLLLNLNNSVNALCGIPLKEELSDRDCRRVLAACIDEAIAVMNANGIQPHSMSAIMWPRLLPHVMRLPNYMYHILAARSLKVDDSARSSMWDDISSGRETEVDFLNGVVIDLGKKANIPTPVNSAIYSLIKDAERAKQCPNLPPTKLLETVFNGANL